MSDLTKWPRQRERDVSDASPKRFTRAWTGRRYTDGWLTADDLAEDYRSIIESLPFVIYLDEASDPIRCERCGTLVVAVPERDAVFPKRPTWRGIWEPEMWRKHTLRRCAYRLEHRLPAEGSDVVQQDGDGRG